jgi:hypothetical protein
MPGNTTGNHFLDVLSVLLSHCSEHLQVFQNETLSRRLSFRNMNKSHGTTVDVPTVVFVPWPKITLQKVLHGKEQCHDAKTTTAVKDLVFFDECVAIKFQNLKTECFLVLEEQIHNE